MSNPGGLDFNVTPYYDDFDEDKKFVRILFRPGRAVQARELSQMQTLFQKQIERFGNYFFKEGGVIDGCEQGLDLNMSYVKLQFTYDSNEVDVSKFTSKTIVGAETGVKAKVGIVTDVEGGDPKTLYINYSSSGTGVLTVNAIPSTLVVGGTIGNANASGTIENWDTSLLKIHVTNITGSYDLLALDPVPVTTLDANGALVTMEVNGAFDGRNSKEFGNDEIIFTSNVENRFYATTAETFATSVIENGTTYNKASKVNVGDGVLYIADHFVKHSNQTIILDKYTNRPSYKIGVVPSKSVVDYIQDSTLVDNAQGTPNYQAPGADRFKLNTILTKVELNSNTAENEFITLMEVEDGIVRKRKSFGIDSRIEDVVSKRTYEESGDYTLTNPKITVREHLNRSNNGGRYTTAEGGNTNLLLVEIDPFTAYVKGFRNEFISKQSVEIRKGLDVQYIEQNKTQINYGNYVEVNEYVGSWDIMQATKVDLYSVPFTAITSKTFNSTSVNTAYKIGEARIRSVEYVSGTIGTPSSRYNVYLFDIVMNSGETFSDVRAIHSSEKFADIVLNEQGNAVLKESSFNNVIFPLPYEAIRSIRDIGNNIESGFSFRKEFDISINTTGSASIVSGDNNETFVGTGLLSETQKNNNYILIPTSTVYCTNVSGTVDASGTTVTGTGTSFATRFNTGEYVKIDTEIHRIVSIANNTHMTIADSHGGTSGASLGKVLPAGVPIPLSGYGSSVGNERAVTVNIPGSTSVTIELMESVSPFNAKFIVVMNRSNAREMKKVLTANANVYIQANTHPNEFTGPYSLGRSDVYRIKAIYQSDNFVLTPTSANTEVTAYYELDNGQRDNTYEHATIIPKLGTTPTGKLLVVFDYFSHDTSQGLSYLSVDSYPVNDVTDLPTTINTSKIPVYTSKTTGANYELRNCLDFRIRKLDDTSNTTNPVDSGAYQVPLGGLHIPYPFSDFDADISVYKGRISKLFLNERGEFGIIDGSPGYPLPQTPPSIPGTLDLSIIDIPAYPSEPKNVVIEPQKNRRYTMQDIGKIEDRVNRLEYYTSLNLIEKQATEVSILDDLGFDRFKSGILVDPFVGYNVADVNSPDIETSINRQEKYATAQVSLNQVPMDFVSGQSSNVLRTEGNKIVLNYTQELFSKNPYASSSLNLTQFLSYNWTGVMNVLPSTDNWFDETNYPELSSVVDFEGNSDNWRQISNAWETEIDSVQTRWIGVPIQQDAIKSKSSVGRIFETSSSQQYGRINFDVSFGQKEVQSQTRNVDISVNHYMRSRDYIFSASGLKPYSQLYAFMDGINVTSVCKQIVVQSGYDVNDVFDLTQANGFLSVSNTVYTSSESGILYANKNGEITGVYTLPEKSFNVGKREFRIVDSANNASSETTTIAKSLVVSQGLSLITSSSQINTRPMDISFASDIERTSISKQVEITGSAIRNPLSQSFFVDDVNYPYGMFISSIALYFKTKSADPETKVYLQIREMENGLPSHKVIGDATTFVKSVNIVTSENAIAATTFTFKSPIYLLSGIDYCFSIIPEGNIDDFEVWIAELGQTDISGTFNQSRIDKQPAAGVLFTSSNDYSWSSRVSQDLKYDIYVAKFDTSATGTVTLSNKEVDANVSYSSLITNISQINFDKTNTTFDVKLSDSSSLLTSPLRVNNLELLSLKNRKTLLTSAQETLNSVKSITYNINMSTLNQYITPVIDLERVNSILYDYKINSSTANNLSGTVSYSASSNVVIGTSTAFTTEIFNGELLKFGDVYRRVSSISNNTYLTTTTDFVTSASDVAISSLNEENPVGPYVSESRYITRRVELEDGFEANDLQVYVDVNRPAGTNIKVYYKVLSDSDEDAFDDKFYQEMEIDGAVIFNEDPNTYSSEKYVVPTPIKTGGSNLLSGTVSISDSSATVTGTSTKFLEELRIGDTVRVNSDVRIVTAIANNTSLTVDSNFSISTAGVQMYKLLYNSIIYTTPDNRTYSGYKYFAIKVVFLSNNVAISPRIKKLKAIALM